MQSNPQKKNALTMNYNTITKNFVTKVRHYLIFASSKKKRKKKNLQNRDTKFR